MKTITKAILILFGCSLHAGEFKLPFGKIETAKLNNIGEFTQFAKLTLTLLPSEIDQLPVFSGQNDGERLRLSLGSNRSGDTSKNPQEEGLEKLPILSTLILPEKARFPNLYYVHLDLSSRAGEDDGSGSDSVGRIWKVGKRTEFLFPFGRWDYPGVQERITLGFALSFRF